MFRYLEFSLDSSAHLQKEAQTFSILFRIAKCAENLITKLFGCATDVRLTEKKRSGTVTFLRWPRRYSLAAVKKTWNPRTFFHVLWFIVRMCLRSDILHIALLGYVSCKVRRERTGCLHSMSQQWKAIRRKRARVGDPKNTTYISFCGLSGLLFPFNVASTHMRMKSWLQKK